MRRMRNNMTVHRGLREYATPERLALSGELATTIQMALDELPDELANRDCITRVRWLELRRNCQCHGVSHWYGSIENIQGHEMQLKNAFDHWSMKPMQVNRNERRNSRTSIRMAG